MVELISDLINYFYQLYPEALSGKELGLSLSELSICRDISEARGILVNKVVESALYKALPEQRNFFMNQLKVDCKEKIIDWLSQRGSGRKAVNYKLRDWLFSRQRYWGEPFPILHIGNERVIGLTEQDLPLRPPKTKDYKPPGTGESPLAKISDWVEVSLPDGTKARRETNTMPQWAGSCWYYLRYIDPDNDKRGWEAEKEKYWMPVDLYIGGAEHAVLHLLYSRFWHKLLYDLGYVSTKEPFKKLVNQGMILAEGVPDEIRKEPNVREIYLGTEESWRTWRDFRPKRT